MFIKGAWFSVYRATSGFTCTWTSFQAKIIWKHATGVLKSSQRRVKTLLYAQATTLFPSLMWIWKYSERSSHPDCCYISQHLFIRFSQVLLLVGKVETTHNRYSIPHTTLTWNLSHWCFYPQMQKKLLIQLIESSSSPYWPTLTSERRWNIGFLHYIPNRRPG